MRMLKKERNMYRLQVKDHFDAAHFLKGYEGKCNREHGHRWDVEICLEGKDLDKINMLIDFSVVKKIMKTLLDRLDHYQLNEQLQEDNVTAEYLARWFYGSFELALNTMPMPGGWKNDPTAKGIRLARVTIWESPECCIKYSPDMKATGE